MMRWECHFSGPSNLRCLSRPHWEGVTHSVDEELHIGSSRLFGSGSSLGCMSMVSTEPTAENKSATGHRSRG